MQKMPLDSMVLPDKQTPRSAKETRKTESARNHGVCDLLRSLREKEQRARRSWRGRRALLSICLFCGLWQNPPSRDLTAPLGKSDCAGVARFTKEAGLATAPGRKQRPERRLVLGKNKGRLTFERSASWAGATSRRPHSTLRLLRSPSPLLPPILTSRSHIKHRHSASMASGKQPSAQPNELPLVVCGPDLRAATWDDLPC